MSAPALKVAEEALPADGPSRRRSRLVPLEGAAVVLSPVVAFFGLHVARMVRPDMIDPYFYTAYAQNGRELLDRYGEGFYYWVRLGFILPARAAYLAFGAVPGFYVLRYLLALVAVVPVYLLLRRLHGPAVGAIGVAVVLASPVILHSWGTDYPDSAAVSYLFAGTACLVMPTAARRARLARLGWVTLSGVALALAVHCQFISAPLVGAIVIAYAAVNLWRQPLDVLAHLAVLAVCAAAVTGALAGLAQLVFGSHNIIAPTITASEHFRTPEQLALWHSTTWRWVLDDTYLLALPAALAGWCAARLGRGGGVSSAELTVVVAVALQGLLYAGLQFYGSTATLEYYLYSSMLWPGVCLVTAFLLGALSRPLLARAWTAAVPVALVALLPLLISQFSHRLQFRLAPPGLLVVAGVTLVALAGRLARKLPASRPAVAANRAAAVGTAAGLVIAGCFAVTIAGPERLAASDRVPGQVKFPHVSYAGVILGDGRGELDAYRIASGLHLMVPAARHRGDDLMLWWPPNQDALVNQLAAQYLWHINSLRGTMPRLLRVDQKKLRARRPGLLLLLSATGNEFPSAVRALSDATLDPVVLRTELLAAGSLRLHASLVSLGAFGGPRPG
jgi:hypothetical protein